MSRSSSVLRLRQGVFRHMLRTNDTFSVEPVPASARRGKVRDLASFWTVANVQLGSVTTGVIASLLGMSLGWAIFAIVVGNLIGCVFMAYHSAQGPKLGLPQMIQSRAQFGVFGALLPLIVAFVLYVGFYISATVLIGEALAELLNIPLTPAIWLGSVVALVITYFGYDVIHKFDRYVSLLAIGIFVVITVVLARSPMHTSGSGDWSLVVLMIAISAGWQLTWAPYVSDYSRYLPEDTSTFKTFTYTYLGAAGGGIWMMIVGALGGAVAADKIEVNPAGYIGGRFPGAPWLAYLTIAAVLILIQAMSLYSGFMSVITGIFPTAKVPNAAPARLVVAIVVGLGATVPGVLVSGNYLESFTNFILFVLYFIIPWTAINIADFYIVRKGDYKLKALFDWRDRYGAVRWAPIVIYVISLGLEIPFMNTTFYEGPFAKMFGGADFAWIVGLLVSGGLYLTVAAPGIRRRDRIADEQVRLEADLAARA